MPGANAPLIVTTANEARAAVTAARMKGMSVGLVPTMGALHAGHVSLIRAARTETDFVAVSIFVNPAQFGPSEDFHRYPRPFDKDAEICRQEGVDLIFHPEPAEMYPPDYHTFVEVHDLQDVLCGASRPGHFRGVATVVLKLFNILQPHKAYFGRKDAQQARIIQQMVEDLNVPVEIRVCPIVRESDGLAQSSRNQYLDSEQRKRAAAIFQALQAAERAVAEGLRRGPELQARVTERLAATPGLRIDYVAVVNEKTLKPIQTLRGRVLVAVAVFFGATRLIDNLVLEIPE